MPSAQKVTPPIAPWITAMTMLPLTVARTTAVKRAISWALYSSLSGIEARMLRPIDRPSRNRKKST